MQTPNLERIGTEGDYLDEACPAVGAEVVLENPNQLQDQVAIIIRYLKTQERVRAFVRLQIDKLRKYEEERLASLQKSIDWLSTPVEQFVRRVHEQSNGKTKSLDLVDSRVGLRAQQPHFDYDEDAVFAWVKEQPEQPDFIETKQILNRAKAKAHIKKTGEDIPGIVVTPAEKPKFYIQIKEEENAEREN